MNGSFTFTPAAGFSGPVNFTYQICDVDGDCSAATATIVVGTADVAPVAQPDTYETPINTPVSGSLTVNDSGLDNGPVVYAVVTPPGPGTAVVNPNGTFTYTPATGFTGVVTFTYQVCDADGDCDTAIVTITVAPSEDTPVAEDDVYVTPYQTPVSGDLSVNDTGLTDAPVSYAVITPPGNGTLVLNPDGTFTYTPATGFSGVVTATIRVCDADADCDTSLATITVGIPPVVANPDSGTVPDGGSGGVAVANVLVNDTFAGSDAFQ